MKAFNKQCYENTSTQLKFPLQHYYPLWNLRKYADWKFTVLPSLAISSVTKVNVNNGKIECNMYIRWMQSLSMYKILRKKTTQNDFSLHTATQSSHIFIDKNP